MRIYSPRGYVDLWVDSYMIPLKSSNVASQTRKSLVFYPTRYSQEDMTVIILTRSRTQARQLAKFLRLNHKDLQKDPSATLRIVDKDYGIDYQGFCATVPDQRSLEDYAPKMALTFKITSGLLSKTTQASSTAKPWENILEDGYEETPDYDPGDQVIHEIHEEVSNPTPIRPK